jgi:hypothetical protein
MHECGQLASSLPVKPGWGITDVSWNMYHHDTMVALLIGPKITQ